MACGSSCRVASPYVMRTAAAVDPFTLLENILTELSVEQQEQQQVPAPRKAPARSFQSLPADILDTSDAYVFTLTAAGFTADDITVEYDDGVLTISGERAAPRRAAGKALLRERRPVHAFKRAFRINAEVDVDAISAALELGILSVTVPKRAPTPPTKVTVKVGARAAAAADADADTALPAAAELEVADDAAAAVPADEFVDVAADGADAGEQQQ